MASKIDHFVGRLVAIERELRSRTMQPQLAYSSIDDGALAVTIDGDTTMAIGQQHDGTSTTTVLVGPPPPPLSGVDADSFIGGLLGSWDGSWLDGVVAPMDFALVEIHVSTGGPDFLPDLVGSGSTTMRGTIASARGGKYAVTGLPYAEHWVKFVARSQAGKWSEPTPAIGPVVPEKVRTLDIHDAAVTAAQLAEDSVTGRALAPGAVDSSNIADFSILVTKMNSTRHTLY
jgi:hypothetical protein